MKNLKKKVFKKNTPEVESAPKSPKAVTNNTVSHHRDEILQRARQFKYPFHRSKHRVAIISIGVVAAALLLLGTVTGLQLYKWQSTSGFTYSVTKIIPFPVAKVGDSLVRYETYLFELGYILHWEERFGTTDLKSPDGQRKVEYSKQLSLERAMVNAIAEDLAKEHDITVSEEEVTEVVEGLGALGGADVEKIVNEQFGLTIDGYRRLKASEILRAKVARTLDEEAPKRAEKVLAEIKGGAEFAEVAKKSSEDAETKQMGGDIGVVEKGRANLPKEVSEVIFKLEPGQVSDVISTANDYFIVTMTERVDENRARVSMIRIRVKDMNQYLKEYREQGKVKEYITLEGDNENQ